MICQRAPVMNPESQQSDRWTVNRQTTYRQTGKQDTETAYRQRDSIQADRLTERHPKHELLRKKSLDRCFIRVTPEFGEYAM